MTSATDTREKLLEDLLDEISGWRSYDGNFMHIYSSVVYAYVKELLDRQAEIVKREYDETHMELPLDADGVPIHVGDEMESGNETFVICAVAPGRVHRWDIHNIGELDKGTVAYPPDSLHHFKPRTVEDVLRDFQQDTLTSQGEYSGEVIDADEWKRQLERDVRDYADELRELMGVD